MPQIELTVPTGCLVASAAATLQKDLLTILQRWEGSPDTAFVRSQSWVYVHEIPRYAVSTAEDARPRFRVDVRVAAGVLDDERKAGLVREATDAVLAAAGLDGDDEDSAMRVWVLIHEQPDGTWGAGGQIQRAHGRGAGSSGPPRAPGPGTPPH